MREFMDGGVHADSAGVHLDEPLTPLKDWEDADIGGTRYEFCSWTPERALMTDQDSAFLPEGITHEFQHKCTTSSKTTTSTVAGSKPSSVQPGRLTKSESPTACQSRINSTAKMTKDSGRLLSSCSSPEDSPATKDSDNVKFTFGSEPDSDEDSGGPKSPISPTPSSSTSSTTKTHTVVKYKAETVTSRRSRFKKILKPLRRSHSAGCNKDVPAHALFLRHEFQKDKPERRSLDRPSMDRRSSNESDNEDQQGEKKGKKKKSLAQDVKEKLAFLRRRHTDTSLDGSSSDSKGRPTAGAILSWSKSFDNLLSDRYGLELFRDFLRSEFSDENLEFWIACEEYKQYKSNKLEAEAQRIFGDFVAVQAPREINLDSKTRGITESNMASPNRRTFEQAQKRIQALMAKDSYRRFLESEFYQDLLAEYKIKIST